MQNIVFPDIDWKKFADDLVRRKAMTAKQRKEDNERFRNLRDSHPKMSRGKSVLCTPLVCAHCLAGLTSEKAMDDHRDKAGHRRFYIELEEL